MHVYSHLKAIYDLQLYGNFKGRFEAVIIILGGHFVCVQILDLYKNQGN